MNTYSFQPVFESEHTLRVNAESPKEAAMAFLAHYPVCMNLIVSCGDIEETVTIAELDAEYPELVSLLKSASIAEPPPELAQAFAEEARRSEDNSLVNSFRRMGYRAAIVVPLFFVMLALSPEVPIPAKIALGSITVLFLAFVWLMFFRKGAR